MRADQEKAAGFARAHGLSMEPRVRFLDLNSELGELSKELLKASGYGEGPITAGPDMKEELGDCVFSLLCLADSLGLDAEGALEEALEKYEKRFAEKCDIGSGR